MVSAAQIVSADDIPADLLDFYHAGVGPEMPTDGLLFGGGSNVVGPDGLWIVAPVVGETGSSELRV